MRTQLAKLIGGALVMGGALAALAWYRHPDRVALQPLVVDEELRADDMVQLRQALAELEPSDLQGPDLVVVVIDGLSAQDPALASLEGFSRSELLACSDHPVSAQACLLTGLPASGHGAYLDRGMGGIEREIPTLSGRLQDAGWTTLSLSGERKLRTTRTGLRRGFDLVLGEDLARGGEKLPYAQGDRVVDLTLAALSGSSGRRFVWVQLCDGRPPWIPRRGFVQEGEELDAFYLPEGGIRKREMGFREAHQALMTGGEVPPAAIQTWRASRDAELAFIDAQLARLLEGLDSDAQVLVVGSVGTEFPGHLELGGVLLESVLRVPLYTRNLDVQADSQVALAHALAAELGVEPLWSWSVPEPQVAEQHRGGQMRLWLDGQEYDPKAPNPDPELKARAEAWAAGSSSPAGASGGIEEAP